MSLLIRTLILLDQGPTRMTPLDCNYLLIGSVSKYSHIHSTHESGGDTIQSIVVTLREGLLSPILHTGKPRLRGVEPGA